MFIVQEDLNILLLIRPVKASNVLAVGSSHWGKSPLYAVQMVAFLVAPRESKKD